MSNLMDVEYILFRLKIMLQTSAIVNRARRLLKRLRHESATLGLKQRFYAVETVHIFGQTADRSVEHRVDDFGG